MKNTKKILGLVLALIVLTLAMSLSIFADKPETDLARGYYAAIYNEDGTLAWDVDASKSASEFNVHSALEDLYVFANNAFLIGLKGTPSFELVMYEDVALTRDLDVTGRDITIDVNGHSFGTNGFEITGDDSLTFKCSKGTGSVEGYTLNAENVFVEKSFVAQIGEDKYETFVEALAAAKAMTGDVVVEIYEKVTLNAGFNGSFTSITFVGKDTDAEIYLDLQGYAEIPGKIVAFEDLTLSKVAGGYVSNAGFMNLAFGIYGATEVSYDNCVFAKGAYAATGKATFTNCEFYSSHDRYSFWAYGDDSVITIDNCDFVGLRGIKMYSENHVDPTINLTVKNSDFTAADGKPAIVLTYGTSVTLENNAYPSKGVFELDLDGKPNGVSVTSKDTITCINDNGACGVLVDGKIYTTVAQAAEVAVAGSKVTLLHNSTETVELAEGVILDKNNFEAAGITVARAGLKGNGTESDPFLIESLEDLILFRDTVNTYTSDGSNQFKGQYVKLKTDIDLDGINWTPIGTNSVGDHMAFLGTFDGDGHTISNLYINADGDHLGFFARVGSYANDCTPTVKNIKFNNVDVSSNTTNGHGGSYVAGVIANAGGNSVVTNVHVTGDVYVVGYGYVGGIVGHGYPDIDNCSVKAEDGSYIHCHYWCVGGIIGYAGEGGTPITNSSVSGVDIWTAYGAGAAIAGLLQDGNKIENVTAENVEITSNSDYCMGYIAGNGECSTITNVTVNNVTATAKGEQITSTDAVATVNGKVYFSLQAAIDAVKGSTGNTITLLADASISGQNALDALTGDTLDLNDKTLTVSGNSYFSNGTTTFTNGNIVVSGYASDSFFCGYTAGAVIVFDDVVITGDNYKTGCALFNANQGKVEIKNSEITLSGDTTGGVIYGGSAVIDNTTIDATNVCRGITNSVATVQNNSVFAFDGGETCLNNSTVTINNSTVTIENATKRAVRLGDNTLALVNGATLTATNCVADIVKLNDSSNAVVTVDTTSTLNAVDNVTVYVAKIGDTYYATFEDAVNAIPTDGTDVVIKILTDIELTNSIYFSYGTGKITFTADAPVVIKQTKVGLDLSFKIGKATTIVVDENVTFEIYDNASGMYVYYGPSLVINGSISGGQNWGCLYLFNGKHRVSTTGSINVGRLQIAHTELTVLGVIDTNYLLVEGADFIANGAIIEVGAIHDSNNGGTRWGASDFSFLNGTVVNANTITLKYADSVINLDLSSSITANKIEGIGKIVIDVSGFNGTATQVINADMSGFTGTVELVNGNGKQLYKITDSGLTIVSAVAVIGENYFATLAEALKAANDGDTITLIWAEGDAPIAMNGSVYGKSVTITGTALVDWSKGNLFIGRGGEGNGTVIFDNANLTSASNNASYGIHVSGREKNTNNKYDGTLIIKNSTIVLDYLINKGNMTLDNSTLTVKNGFAIGGRPASETESGADATATITLNNGSKVVVNNHNGMGLGYEAIGVMNVNANSTFECTQDFLVTAKGTMNVNGGTIKVAGTFTNNGTIDVVSGTFSMDPSAFIKEGYTAIKNTDGMYVVRLVPTATVKPVYGPNILFGLTFNADEITAEQFEFFGDWFADFTIVFNKNLTLNANGTGDGWLSGQYDEWSENWVNVPFEDVKIEAGKTYKVMELAAKMLGKPDLKVTYADVAEFVEEFNCGVYLDDEFIAANPDFKVEIGLSIFNPADETIEVKAPCKDKAGNPMQTVFTKADIAPKIPTATVKPVYGPNILFGLTFNADEITAEQLEFFGDWFADFTIVFNKNLTLNANGTGDGWLSGQYDEWSENWVNVPFEDVKIEAGKTYKVMELAAKMLGKPDLKVTYADVAEFVEEFNCGVYLDDEFIAANPDFKVEIGLSIFNPADETIEVKAPCKDKAGNPMQTVFTKADIAPKTPTATVTPIGPRPEYVFGLNFAVDTNITEAQAEFFANWFADFVIVFNKDITLDANGSGDGWLTGQYDAWSEGWVNVPFSPVTIKAGEPVKIMEFAAILMNKPGLKFTCAEVFEIVKNFNCGVYLTEEFVAENPDFEVSIALNIYHPDNEKVAFNVSEEKTFDAEDIKRPVAQIGNTYYASLQEAIAAIGSGDVVIELLADATLDYNAREAYGLAETTSVKINGNGHTLTLNQKNSDWASIGLANAGAKLVLNNMTIEKTGYGDTSGAWNTHAIIFKCNVEMNNVTVNNSVAVQNGATLNNVTINEANGYYGLWINANGQSVTMNGGAINATNGGRGIKIADQYVDSVAKVELSITDTVFNTAKKAAVLVTSPEGATITASNVDITNVAADSTNIAWVDENCAANFAETTVNGGAAAQESVESFAAAITSNGNVVGYYKTIADAIAAANAGETITLLRDITSSEVILIYKSLTINGNNHKVTSSASRVFRVTTSNTEVTLNGVNMVSTAVRVGSNDIRGISIDVLEKVKLTLNNCSVDFTDASACDWAYAVNVTGGSGYTVTVNGGTYEGANVINVRGTSQTVVVKDATLTSLYPNHAEYYGSCIWVLQKQGSSVEATGNTFNGSNAIAFNLGTGTALTESNNTDNTTRVVAKIGEAYYTSLADAFAAAQNGDEVEILVAGTYALGVSGKNITVTGLVDGVVFDNIGAYNMGGASVTFNNVTFDYYPNVNYTGLQHSGNLVYNNCTFNGQVFLYGTSETFNKCTFNQNSADAYNVWTYGAKEVAFNECTFNSAGKSVLVYNETSSVTNNVAIAGSTFNASAPVDGKAAIEIDTSLTAGANITIDAATTAKGFANGNVSGNSLWNNKKGSNTDANNDITVVVGGNTVLAPVTFVAKIGNIGYTSLADAFAAAQNGDEIKIYVAGTYALSVSGKDIIITGAVDGVVFDNIGAYNMGGANVTFNNVTFDYYPNVNYTGLQHSGNLVYNDCTFNGQVFLYGTSETFNNCTFNQNSADAYNVWTYSAKKVEFNECTFNCVGKAVLVYNETSSVTNDVAITKSTFIASAPVVGKAAIEIDTSLSGGATIKIDATTATGFGSGNVSGNSLWNNKKGNNTEANNDVTVVVGDKTVLAPVTFVAKIGNIGYTSLQEALEAAKNEENIVIELLADATLDITAWQTLAIGGDTTKTITINGNGKTLTFNKLNSDWNHVATNNDAKLVLNDMTITDSGKNDGPWNRYDIVFACDVKLNNVTSTKALAFKADATLKTVTITEEKDAYAIWIQPNGQTIAIDGLVVNSAGRGIKIDNQYVEAQATTLEIANAKFTTANKAAILVKSDAKTTINVGENVDISGVTADSNNIAWTDEDAAADYGKVTVNGGTLVQESIEDFVASVIVNDKVEGYYKTLAEAFAAVNGTTATVQVLADIATDSAITIANGTTVTLDLNGKTITGTDNATASFGLITNKGNLTINDTVGGGKITLTATNDRGWDAYSSVISNTVGGKLVVENGTIEHLGGTDMAYAIDNLTNGKGTYAETVINGGTIKSTYRAIRQFLNGIEAQNILTVNGGTIEGANKAIWFQDPSKNANSGTLTVGANAVIKGDIYLTVTAGSTEWPVEVSITASAVNGEVLSNNVPEGYIVEENADGIVIVREANYIAEANGVKYESLAEAIAKANGGTVTLLANIELNEAVVINGNVTIDLATFEVSLNSTTVNCVFHIENGTVTIKNGTISTNNGQAIYAGLDKDTSKAPVVTLENVTLNGADFGLSVFGGANVTIGNGVAINGSVEALRVWNSATVTVNAGATITCTGSGNDARAIAVYEAASVSVVGGTFTGAVDAIAYNGKTPTLVITGGTFTVDVNQYCANGYICVADGEAYIVREGKFVAQVGETKYETLAEAIAVGGEVKLLADTEISETIIIAKDTVVTLDLNGYTINVAYAEGSTTNHIYAFTNNGTFTITGNGTINARGIFNYGTMTLENGTINAIDGNGGYAVRNYEGAKFVMNGGTIATTLEDDHNVDKGGYDATTVRVDAGATFIMNGGTINNICDYTFAIDNAGTVVVNDGTVSSVHSTISTYGTLTIKGGTFTCDGIEGITAHVIVAWDGSQTTINGGTFDGKDNYNGFNVDADEGAYVEIKGGTFLAVHSGSLYGKGTIAVSGGTFFDEVPADRCASGYACVNNGNGTYSVKKVELFGVNKSSLTLETDFAVNFWYKLENFADKNYYAVITKHHEDSCICDSDDVIYYVPYDEWSLRTSDGVNYMSVSAKGIAAKELVCEIFITIYRGTLDENNVPSNDSYAVSKTQNISVAGHIDKTINKTIKPKGQVQLSEKTLNEYQLYADLLIYGREAQILFNHYMTKNGEPVYATNAYESFEALLTYATAETPEINNETTIKDINGNTISNQFVVRTSLTLENTIYYNLQLKNLKDANKFKVEYRFIHNSGVEHFYTTDKSVADADGYIELVYNYEGNLVVQLTDLAPADLRNKVEVKIYTGESAETLECVSVITTSVEDQCARGIDQQPENAKLYESIMKLADSAQKFFK